MYAFYAAMAVYGWWVWWHGGNGQDDLPVVRWPIRVHAVAVVLIVVAVAVSGGLLSRFTDAAYPYVDSATTFSAIWATFLVTRKVFDNWWYWLLIDTVSIGIYWSRGLELTAVLFIAYVVLVPIGMLQWARALPRHTAALREPTTDAR